MEIEPSLELLKKQASQAHSEGANTYVVRHTTMVDYITPHSAYLRLAKPGSPDAKQSFLLESAVGGEKVDRYSFLGTNPRKSIITGPGRQDGAVDPLVLLEKELNQSAPYPSLSPEGLPPFTGGAVGYVAYDCIKYFEPRTQRPLKDTLDIPEAMLMIYDTIVCLDNVYQKIHIIHNIHCNNLKNLEAQYQEATEKIQEVYNKVMSREDYTVPQPRVTPNHQYASNIGQEGYESHVRELKKHILCGDIIQAVPSQRIIHPTDLHPFNIYRQLRSVNPSPYMFYLDFLDFQLIGASPEVLVKLENGRILTHPIAGTVRRGKTTEEDDKLGASLLHSAKDRAEHVMLVDLARNDVNRVCEPLSSSVDFLMKLERFSHVTHLVSQCSGILRPEKNRFDALRSIFPAGTVSGAPKIKAMELVSELEGEVRGAYAGAVGSWGFDKSQMNTCIALRTMMYKDGKVYLQAGGGIVHDSDPTEEYEETMNKMGANRRCLEDAEHYWASKTGGP